MKPMKTKKEAIAFCVSLVLVGLFLFPIEAKAESWKEVIPNRYSYNSDFTFVDRGTGFIVVETADANNDGSFFYALTAIDCDGWIFYLTGPRNENGSYDIRSYWRTDPRFKKPIQPNSFVEYVAIEICRSRSKWPFADILP